MVAECVRAAVHAGVLSMRPAEHAGEGHGKNHLAELVADVQDPAAPVLLAGLHDERPHHQRGVVLGLRQVADRRAASIDPDPFGAAAMRKRASSAMPCSKRSGP